MFIFYFNQFFDPFRRMIIPQYQNCGYLTTIICVETGEYLKFKCVCTSKPAPENKIFQWNHLYAWIKNNEYFKKIIIQSNPNIFLEKIDWVLKLIQFYYFQYTIRGQFHKHNLCSIPNLCNSKNFAKFWRRAQNSIASTDLYR